MTGAYIYLLVLIALISIIYILYTPYGESFTNAYELPHIVWSYWEGSEVPKIVELAHARVKQKLPGWDVRLLDPITVKTYINMESIPKNYESLGIQHKADWIRLALLRDHGGVWLDATIIVNDGAALENLVKESREAHSEFTGFTLGGDSYIENWFMMAPKGSEVIDKLYTEFSHAITLGFDEYKNELANDSGVNIDPRIYSFGTYLTQHSCIQAVIQARLGRKPRLVLKPAEESMFKIQTECNWDFACFIDKIMKHETYKIPYLKLRNGEKNFDYERYFSEGFIPGGRVGWAN